MELEFEKLAKQILGEGIGEPGAGAAASAAHERYKDEQRDYAANRSQVWGGTRSRPGGYDDHDDVGETKQSYYLSRDGGKSFVFGKDKLTGKPKIVSFNSLDKARSLVSKFPGAQIVDGNKKVIE